LIKKKIDNKNEDDKKFPFDILCFKNCNSDKRVKIKIEIKNGKSFCIYNNKDIGEDNTSVIKEIMPKKVNCILVMRYNKESAFDITYKIL